MSDKSKNQIIESLVETLDIPETAYQKAEARYKSLGEWFKGPQSKSADHDPHIYPQGSFRLGTVVRPLTDEDEYDLDVGCRLRAGVAKATHTQKQLKDLVGYDLEAYRKARQIENEMEEMHRCWRLGYKDEVKFHMDTVPSIPEEVEGRRLLEEAMIERGTTKNLAANIAAHAGAITDNRHHNYSRIALDWRISNSEGYAQWFEFRMTLEQQLMERRTMQVRAGRVDDLPARKWKSPLQRVVQILKRHRDLMFKDDVDGKPISIIITTLAAQAYQGESDVNRALEGLLNGMANHIRPSAPRVPNPVNPIEDFADKWGDPLYEHLNLERNFRTWLSQAQADFRLLLGSRDSAFIVKQALAKFGAILSVTRINEALGIDAPFVATTPKSHVISEAPAKPWVQLT